jgi:RHS repeat-associated protein
MHQLPNKLITHSMHDNLGRLTDSFLTLQGSDDSWRSSHFEYDAVGNIRHHHDSDFYGGSRVKDVKFGYDRSYRLIEEVVEPQQGSWTATSYSYDAGDRRTSLTRMSSTATAETINYSYSNDGRNRLLSATVVGTGSTTEYGYDDNGNRIRRIDASGTENYAFDVENRLVGISSAAGTQTFKHDYRSRRIARTAGAVTTQISYSGQLSALEWTDTAATPSKQFIRGAGMEGGVGGLNYVLEGGTASTLHYNHRGDVIMKSDAQGLITHGWSYDAFGKATQRKGSEGTLRHAASTKEADTALLLNEGFRERDVETGLFLSTDPLEFVDGPNMYAYVRQNPVSSFDPWGLAKLTPEIEAILHKEIQAAADIADLVDTAAAKNSGHAGTMKHQVFGDLLKQSKYSEFLVVEQGINKSGGAVKPQVYGPEGSEVVRHVKDSVRPDVMILEDSDYKSQVEGGGGESTKGKVRSAGNLKTGAQSVDPNWRSKVSQRTGIPESQVHEIRPGGGLGYRSGLAFNGFLIGIDVASAYAAGYQEAAEQNDNNPYSGLTAGGAEWGVSFTTKHFMNIIPYETSPYHVVIINGPLSGASTEIAGSEYDQLYEQLEEGGKTVDDRQQDLLNSLRYPVHPPAPPRPPAPVPNAPQPPPQQVINPNAPVVTNTPSSASN